MANIKIDTAKLNKAIAIAFDQTVDKLDVAFDEAIRADVYEWPRPTKRKSKKVVTSPRDIVDTGELMDSKVIARASASQSVEFSWDVPYAAAVHEGATLRNGTELPARRWTERAIEECDPKAVFEQELRRYL